MSPWTSIWSLPPGGRPARQCVARAVADGLVLYPCRYQIPTHHRSATTIAKGCPVEIIRLSGSIELAPLVGLCERIVDLVETGRTMAENGLVVVGEVMRVSARLIINRASQKTKYEQVTDLISRLKQVI